MADFILRKGNPAFEIPRDFIDIVCLTQLASVSRCPIEGRLQLVTVQFDGAVAIAFLACPLNEVRIEDNGMDATNKGLTKKSTPFVLPPLLTQPPRWGMPLALRSSGCLRGSMFISLTPTRR